MPKSASAPHNMMAIMPKVVAISRFLIVNEYKYYECFEGGFVCLKAALIGLKADIKIKRAG